MTVLQPFDDLPFGCTPGDGFARKHQENNQRGFDERSGEVHPELPAPSIGSAFVVDQNWVAELPKLMIMPFEGMAPLGVFCLCKPRAMNTPSDCPVLEIEQFLEQLRYESAPGLNLGLSERAVVVLL